MHPATANAKSSNNPFIRPAEMPTAGEPATQTDLDDTPASLEISPPTPPGAQSRSPTPENPAHGSPGGVSSLSQTIYQPPPGPPPSGPPAHVVLDAAIAEELPPAYTPTADPRQGETSVKFGPRRPFQTAPARGAYVAYQRTQRPSWQPHNTGGSGWAGYPGTAPTRRQPPGAPLINITPPPQHPALPPRSGPLSAPPNTNSRPLSDFARDFYAAAAGPSNGASSLQRERSVSDARGPPPEMPPRPDETNGSNEIANDGRPTKKPVPGHPLLNSGKVLVYPASYECNKCAYLCTLRLLLCLIASSIGHNTGYKHFDPSNPCSKCWSKYAKAYAGPLTYAPWTPANAGAGAAEATASAGHNLQRPLPAGTGAGSTGHRYSHSLTDLNLSPPHSDLGRSASTSRQYNTVTGSGYPGNSSPYAPPPQRVQPAPTGGGWPPASWMDPNGGGSVARRSPYIRAPPPGATVVRPGDPRIGGRLCWRCGGSGVTSFLIFDEQTCTVCNGLGRTFP